MKRKNIEKTTTRTAEVRSEKQIETLERDIKKLRAANKNLQDLLHKNEECIFDITKGWSTKDLIQDTKNKNETVKELCPQCHKDELRRIKIGDTILIGCDNCPYRNREHASSRRT